MGYVGAARDVERDKSKPPIESDELSGYAIHSWETGFRASGLPIGGCRNTGSCPELRKGRRLFAYLFRY